MGENNGLMAIYVDPKKQAGIRKTAGACPIAFQDTSPAPRFILYRPNNRPSIA